LRDLQAVDDELPQSETGAVAQESADNKAGKAAE